MTHRSHSHAHSHSHHGHQPSHPGARAPRTATFSKIFRWQPEKPGDPAPATVEVAGSFSGWRPLPLKHDKTTNMWQLSLNDIPGNCTHSYMLLVDGKPAPDKNSDGYVIPHNDDEKRHALITARGPRVFMLFSQTK
jgi:hypothetical protein